MINANRSIHVHRNLVSIITVYRRLKLMTKLDEGRLRILIRKIPKFLGPNRFRINGVLKQSRN